MRFYGAVASRDAACGISICAAAPRVHSRSALAPGRYINNPAVSLKKCRTAVLAHLAQPGANRNPQGPEGAPRAHLSPVSRLALLFDQSVSLPALLLGVTEAQSPLNSSSDRRTLPMLGRSSGACFQQSSTSEHQASGHGGGGTCVPRIPGKGISRVEMAHSSMPVE
eukprot:CAMPEP_0181181618 /NCGR_PEP_ID=MMETSP1096-20121128/7435_1 /TAXON_ID=156174 ORGANISM="Chrysochromulina ericina, Strain CCMP281" /NCGR_SAMPLE_ID=MMETSP1096 /ASSEMBLY_ACC=CAM_ASM_000453 /LENGTH=166 /DNA_ID=CAMNT_0023270137 /DNA_START=229 /DNA_END=727 /DNA_ORIENTATION=-